MTHNQIAWQEHLENVRHNKASEGETYRSNQARELEANRSNVAKETISMAQLAEDSRSHRVNEAEALRSHLAEEAETRKSHRNSELISAATNDVRAADVVEKQRHNIAQETISAFDTGVKSGLNIIKGVFK